MSVSLYTPSVIAVATPSPSMAATTLSAFASSQLPEEQATVQLRLARTEQLLLLSPHESKADCEKSADGSQSQP
jgi:hypothetical protein